MSMTVAEDEAPPPAPPRRGLGMVATAIWAAFAIAAPTVILYRHSRDNKDSGGKVGGGNTVTMAQIAFKPTTLTVARGAEVLFVNKDIAPHTVTQDGGSIDSGVLNPGKTFTLKVNDAFEYVCTIHPNMKAKVVLSG